MGTVSGFKRFTVGIPISSCKQNRSVIKQLSSKCLEHSWESTDGPFQLLCCHLTALTHLLRIDLSFGNLWKMYSFPLTLSQPAAFRYSLGIMEKSVIRYCNDSYLKWLPIVFVLRYANQTHRDAFWCTYQKKTTSIQAYREYLLVWLPAKLLKP